MPRLASAATVKNWMQLAGGGSILVPTGVAKALDQGRSDQTDANATITKRDRLVLLARRHPGLVFGEGSAEASLVIVGEAPGVLEASLGRPFVGGAGEFLDVLLGAAGFARADVWLTNVVKRRPVALAGGRIRSRPPTLKEVRADLPILREELRIIDPRVVLCLGTVAARALINERFRLSADRGRWFSLAGGARALATFHPAYLRRWHGRADDPILALARRDFTAVARALAVERARIR